MREVDARGNAINSHRGSGAIVNRSFDPWTGRLLSQNAGSAGSLQNEQYDWDAVGNMAWREQLPSGGMPGWREEFEYDAADRLTTAWKTEQGGVAISPPEKTHEVQFDKLGNTCRKRFSGALFYYSYAGRAGCGTAGLAGSGGTGTGPHRTSGITSVDPLTFVPLSSIPITYDANGRYTLGDPPNGTFGDKTFTYTGRQQVRQVQVANGSGGFTDRVDFRYDARGARYKQVELGGVVRTTLTLGNVERVVQGGQTTWRRYIGDVAIQVIENSSVQTRYVYKDVLGSIVTTTNSANVVMAEDGRRSHAPDGRYRDARSPTQGEFDPLPQVGRNADSPTTQIGFTGHLQADRISVIHMGARTYDPILGRMQQADPVVQQPYNPQNGNRYSYVVNNPLRYTDPTGESFADVLRAVVGIAIAVYMPYLGVWGNAAGGFWATTTSGFVAGAVTGGSLRSGVYGAFSAAAFFGVGTAFKGVAQNAGAQGTVGQTGLTAGQYAAKTLTHGIVGGVMSSVQGGKFGHGFVSAGAAQAASAKIDGIGAAGSAGTPARVVAAAMLGGVVSSATGGKFANGAITGAFSRAFNDEAMHRVAKRQGYFDGEYLSSEVMDQHRENYVEKFSDQQIAEANQLVTSMGVLVTGGGAGFIFRALYIGYRTSTAAARIGAAFVRTTPRNLVEQLVMQEARAGSGVAIMAGKIKDPRYPAHLWQKMQHVHKSPSGQTTTIH